MPDPTAVCPDCRAVIHGHGLDPARWRCPHAGNAPPEATASVHSDQCVFGEHGRCKGCACHCHGTTPDTPATTALALLAAHGVAVDGEVWDAACGDFQKWHLTRPERLASHYLQRLILLIEGRLRP